MRRQIAVIRRPPIRIIFQPRMQIQLLHILDLADDVVQPVRFGIRERAGEVKHELFMRSQSERVDGYWFDRDIAWDIFE